MDHCWICFLIFCSTCARTSLLVALSEVLDSNFFMPLRHLRIWRSGIKKLLSSTSDKRGISVPNPQQSIAEAAVSAARMGSTGIQWLRVGWVAVQQQDLPVVGGDLEHLPPQGSQQFFQASLARATLKADGDLAFAVWARARRSLSEYPPARRGPLTTRPRGIRAARTCQVSKMM